MNIIKKVRQKYIQTKLEQNIIFQKEKDLLIEINPQIHHIYKILF